MTDFRTQAGPELDAIVAARLLGLMGGAQMMPDLTEERLAEIRAACEAATPGPWEADLSPGSDPDEGYPNHGWVWAPKTYSDSEGDYMLWEDVQFCVLARTAVPELLAEVERLRAQFNLVCELGDQHLCLPDPECEHCGKPASCLGAYEGAPEAWACDECCSHSNEDGHCVMVRDLPRIVEGLRGQASNEPFFERQALVLETENARLRAEVEAMRAERDAVRAEVDRLRAGATRECGMLDLGHTEPANVCDACYVQVVHMLGEAEAENARLRAKVLAPGWRFE